MPSRAAREVYRVLIEAVYRRWNSEKISDVPQIMEKYKGQEDEIYDKVVRKYVFCHKETVWRPLIEAMYKRFNESKLQDLPQILSKYKKSEAALYRALCDKYIPGVKKGEPPPDVNVWPEIAESVSPISTKSAEAETNQQAAAEAQPEPPANAEPEAEPASAPAATASKTSERPAESSESEYPAPAKEDSPAKEEEGDADQAEPAVTSVKEEDQEEAPAEPAESLAEELAATSTAAGPEEASTAAEASLQQSSSLAEEGSALPAAPDSAPAEAVQSHGSSVSEGPTLKAEEQAPELAAVTGSRQHRPRRREAALAAQTQDGTPVQPETAAALDKEARRAARREARRAAAAAAGEPPAQVAGEASEMTEQQQPDQNGDRNGMSELHQLPPAKRALDEVGNPAEGHQHRSRRRRRVQADSTTVATQQEPAMTLAEGIGAGDQLPTEATAGPVEARRVRRSRRLAAGQQHPMHSGQELAAELGQDENGKRTASSELNQSQVAKRPRVEGETAPEGQKHRSRRRRAAAASVVPAEQQLSGEAQTSEAPGPERPLATRPKASRRPPPRPRPSAPAPELAPAEVTAAAVAGQTQPKSEWEKAWEAKRGTQASEDASSSTAVPGAAAESGTAAANEAVTVPAQSASQEGSAEEAQAAIKRREAALRQLLHQKRLRAGAALVSVAPVQSSRETPHSETQAQQQPAAAAAAEAAATQSTPERTVPVRKSRRHHLSSMRTHRKVTLAPAEQAADEDEAETPKVCLRSGQEAAIRAKALKMFGISRPPA